MTERLTDKNFRLGFDDSNKLPSYEAIYERLRKYETAEEEGRLVVLPCKVGSTVYRILYTLAFGEIGDKAEKHYFIRETSFEYGMIDDLNETVFLTHEEAEKALKEMEENHE